MSNNKQNHIGEANKMVSSVEWLQAIELERDLTLADWNKAKAMHKEETINFALCYTFGQYNVPEKIRMNIEKDYNETFGGNNEQNDRLKSLNWWNELTPIEQYDIVCKHGNNDDYEIVKKLTLRIPILYKIASKDKIQGGNK